MQQPEVGQELSSFTLQLVDPPDTRPAVSSAGAGPGTPEVGRQVSAGATSDLLKMAREGRLFVFIGDLPDLGSEHAPTNSDLRDFSPDQAEVHDKNQTPVCQLSDRQRQIVDLLLTGFSERRIAAALGISEKTVQAHIARLKLKLNLDSLFQLGAHLARLGLI